MGLIAVRRGDIWDLVRCACLEITECIFDNAPSSHNIHEKLKEATLYMNLCIETNQKRNNLMKQTIQLSYDDTSQTKSLSDILLHLMKKVFRHNETAKETDDMKKYSARDVVYLLRMLVQECDDMSNFSEVSTSLKQDVHVCLKKIHETYSAACCISIDEMLADRSSSSVVRNSISTMLVPRVPKSTSFIRVKSMVLYMILGGADDSTTSIQFPVFTKFVLLRDEILGVELKLMKLRSLLADSSFWNSKALIRQAGEKFQVVMEEILIMLCTDVGK